MEKLERFAREEAALRRLLAGDRDASAARIVAESLMSRLSSFLKRRVRGLSRDDADDLAREALAVALDRRDRFDPARGAAATSWLHGIARLLAAEHLRRHGREA